MSSLKQSAILLAAFCFVSQAAIAQALKLPETRNAALRYWIAFALMQDPPADKGTAELLEKVASSSADWDEAKLGPILDQNLDAILAMQRATRLPECNWGLEYELGPDTPIPHVAKARVLARLNVLYGMRLATRDENSTAVDAWLAGLRFSQHLAQNSSLLGLLVAKNTLLSDLRAMAKLTASGSLDDVSLARIDSAVRALPEGAFDWGHAIQMETLANEVALQQFARSPDPGKLYQAWFREQAPSPLTMPSASEIQEYKALMSQTAASLRLPYAEARETLANIDLQVEKLNPLIRRTVPSLDRINEARAEVISARRNLLQAIAQQRRH